MALLLLVAGAIGTFIVWRLAKNDEREHIERITALAASAVHADLVSDMQYWIQDQVRLARLWEVERPSQLDWAAYANLYIEHHPGCLKVEWLSPAGEERWVVRTKDADAHTELRLEAQRIPQELLETASRPAEVMVSSILTAPQGEKQWFTAVPIYPHGRFHGFVIGWFDARQSLDTMLDDIKGLKFSMVLEQGGREFYRLPGSTDQYRNPWEQSFAVPFPGTSWRLGVWSKPEAMLQMRSNMPTLVLLFGTLLTLLLTGIAQAHHQLKSEIAERRRIEGALRASQVRFAGILEISAAAVISTDDQQRIMLFNQSAEAMFGYKAAEALGQPLGILIPQRFREMHRQHFADFGRSDRKNLLMSGRAPVTGLHKDGTEFPMAASISKLALNGEKTFTVLCTDITEQVRAAEELRKAHDELETRVRERTAALEQANLALQSEISERKAAENEVQQLSRRVLRVQDEERRHLARELHDGAAQNLVAVILNLRCLGQEAAYDRMQHARIEECVKLVEQCTNELRTISYLLHPPFLEQLGLTRTLISYIDGFSRRSGIEVSVRIDPELGRLAFDAELTLFRIVQEGLSNIHRHSRSRTAAILLARQGENVVLEVADQGNGMPAGAELTGVGIAGMRERVRILKGHFNITTAATGTILRAVLPSSTETVDLSESEQVVSFEI